MKKQPNSIFVDTSFVIALINERDLDHAKALKLADQYNRYPFVTIDSILQEIENALSPKYKKESQEILTHFHSSDNVTIIHLSSLLLQKGIEMYAIYHGQNWDLVDCLAFVVMHEMGIRKALTSDLHFEQANFQALMR